MTTTTDSLASIPTADLGSIWGGGFLDTVMGYASALNSGKATGTGPNALAAIFDNPPRAYNTARDFLGIAPSPRSGSPGETYNPATLGSDGSVSQGFFNSGSDVAPPMSE